MFASTICKGAAGEYGGHSFLTKSLE